MIFGKRKFPKTREEYEAAMKGGVAAVIKTDITSDVDIPSGEPFIGDPLLVLIYEGGFMRAQFPSGRVMATQCSDVERDPGGRLDLRGGAYARMWRTVDVGARRAIR